MALPTSELAKKLARRRVGEQVFESAVLPSTADVGCSEGAAAATGPRVQEHQTCIQAPEDVGSTFEAALERIRAFEKAQAARGSRPSRQPNSLREQAKHVPKEAAPSAVIDHTRNKHQAAAEKVFAAKPDLTEARRPISSNERQSLKSAVQERFAALVREGLKPNEAAARAILEAVGQPQHAVEEQRSTARAPSRSSRGSSPRSHGTQRSCASSAKEAEVQSKHPKKKAVAVVA